MQEKQLKIIFGHPDSVGRTTWTIRCFLGREQWGTESMLVYAMSPTVSICFPKTQGWWHSTKLGHALWWFCCNGCSGKCPEGWYLPSTHPALVLQEMGLNLWSTLYWPSLQPPFLRPFLTLTKTSLHHANTTTVHFYLKPTKNNSLAFWSIHDLSPSNSTSCLCSPPWSCTSII